MKLVAVLLALSVYLLAEYQTGKIDMHGGKNSYSHEKKKSSFGSKNMGMTLFLDKNSSKKSEDKKISK